MFVSQTSELYQISEGVLGYSNVIDLHEPPTIIVHPRVCDINRYKPFIEKHTGLIIVLEEDHELSGTLDHFDPLKRFTKSFFSRQRLNNFLYVPTANNDPMPMWGITDYEYGITSNDKIDQLGKTSWLKFAQLIDSLRSGENTHFQINNYNPAIQTQPVRLAGGYWPSGCAGTTKSSLEYYGINVEPIEDLMYRPFSER
ncbi:MAG: hypothetical protein AAB656_01180 [Patescibacteria group bacterium]